MILLLMLSAAQLCLLPGLLISRLVFRSGSPGIVPGLVFAFGASLVINYLVVSGLTSFQLYTPAIVRGLVATEVGLALVWLVHSRFDPARSVVRGGKVATAFFTWEPSVLHVARLGLLAAAVAAFAGVVGAAGRNAGQVFEGWDAVVSWNRWAADWAANRLPVDTWHYPQLLPANWSLSYVLTGSDLQFVARGVMPLFLVVLVAHTVWLGFAWRSAGLLAAAALLPALRRTIWLDGYADAAVAAMAGEALLWVLMAVRERHPGRSDQLLAVAAMFAAGAAVTKQAGLYLYLVLPALVAVLARRGAVRRLLPVWLGLGAVIVLPFYAWVEWLIARGVMGSEIPYVTGGIFRGAGLWERFRHACGAIPGWAGSPAAWWLVAGCWIAGWWRRDSRILAGLVVVPFFLVWALWFSYDLRNASLLVPAFCLGAGSGFEILLVAANRRAGRVDWSQALRWLPGAALAGLLVALIVASVAVPRLSASGLRDRQERLQRRIGTPWLNDRLYALHMARPIRSFILTDYQPLRYLPGLREHAIISQTFASDGAGALAAFRAAFAARRIGYVLAPEATGRLIGTWLDAQVAAGRFRVVPGFDGTGYRMLAAAGVP